MSTAATLPRIHFPPELPVSRMREEIAHAIRDNQVVIVAGATGSGKTTQLPKIALELGRTSIGHTQPRRIAARTIAERIAEELGQSVGELVGYQVRFTDKVSRATRIKLMTDGILLNELRRDRLLRAYDTIIIDEAHERSLNIDFLLGYLKQLLPQRPDLKLIITSATIDPESFARHFAAADGSPAPIVEVSGRTYPVEIRYRPLVAEALEDGTDDADDPDPIPSADRDYLQGINDALDELAREASGDVLVFLSGENEIRDAADAIRGRNLPGTEVLPLYGRLSAAEQHRVFQASTTPGIRRRVVLATNVAETSLTVPGIKYVVDAGTARISRYSTRAKVQRLPIEAISQASANQRSGRSGRTSDGIAIRLYSEEDFEKRPEFTEPEILRTNLAAVILQMISLGLGDIAAFPFLTPPDSRGIKDGLDLLTELGAISSAKNGAANGAKSATANGADTRLTPVGRQLAQLPIDPRFARMVVESKRHSTSREVMAIVAGLTIQDPRERPVEKRGSADEKHARFADPGSDFLTLLNLWNYLEEQQKELSSSAFRRLCKAEYLNFLRVREWQDVYRQLRQLAKPLGLTIGEPSVNPDGIHRSLLAGLLSHIGLKDLREPATGSKNSAHGSARGPRSSEYLGARQTRFVIFPGSTLAKKQPNAVMSAELVETSRLFARMNAAIDPAWAEPIAGDLCKRQYSEPHWEKGQGSVVAYERVTLFGVPIIPRRRVQYARIDAELSRELFIRHALVDGEWDSHQSFDRANRKLRAELRELEERTRRRDILNDDEAVFEFYDKRIPADVASTRSFEGWWKKARQETPDLLTMTPEALLDEEAAEVDEDAFPPVWRQGDQQLTLRYRFEPGAEDDGVTVQVPLPLLAGLLPDGFDWQVPGLRHELVTALIKSLPKAIRRQVVPAADWARRLLGELAGTAGMRAHEGERPAASLTETLAATISRLTGSRVSASDFDLERLPAHLRPTFEVIGERGRTLAGGKDLGALQDRLRSRARDSVAAVAEARTPNALERAGLTTWDFDELPRFLDTTHTGPGGTQNVIRAYPALVDDGGSVSIRLMGTPAEQARAIPGGVRRLLLASIPSPVAYVQQHLTSNEKLTLAASPYPNTKALFDDCLLAVVDSVLYRMKPDGQVFMRAEFEAVRDRVSGIVMDAMFETVALVTRILTAARAAEKAIAGVTALTYLSALNDAKGQLGGLVWAGGPTAAGPAAAGPGAAPGAGAAPGYGFVSATGLEQLRHLPRYLAGISQRMQALPTNPGRDRAWQTQVETAVALYTDAGGRIPLAPDSPPSLVHARWMLEEFRVSLFAQTLGTAESTSLQRIRKVLTP